MADKNIEIEIDFKVGLATGSVTIATTNYPSSGEDFQIFINMIKQELGTDKTVLVTAYRPVKKAFEVTKIEDLLGKK
ncbi:hypothetical protein NIES22_73800 (plasmid) [Calothrix brevissima NIES-22]|nr:hypothetical protein NIES22_73800 [Calothrix brevissima NIES-22]